MKNLFYSLLCLSFFLLIAAPSHAITAAATVNARVVTPIAIAVTSNLQFGSFTSSATSGTITQAGIVTGGVATISSGATRSAGVFTVTGEASTPTNYTFTLSATLVTLTSGANTMPATLSYASGNGARILTSGTDVVTINGSLAVGANQVAGAYTGTYSVTAVY